MKDKSCKYFEKLLPDYLNNNLEASDKAFCRTHTENCKKCSSEYNLKEINHAWNLLEQIPEVKPSPDFMLQLQKRVYQEEEKQRLYWLRLDKIFTLLKAPAMAFIIFGIILTSNLTYAYTNKDIKGFPASGNKIEFKNKTEQQERVNKINSNIAAVVKTDIETVLQNFFNSYNNNIPGDKK